jgi:hypothetical protein
MFSKRQLYLIEQCVNAELEQNNQCDTALSLSAEEDGTEWEDLRTELIEIRKMAEQAQKETGHD